MDLKAAFDSINRPALWSLLISIGIPPKLVRLFQSLYTDTVSCVRVAGSSLNSCRLHLVSGKGVSWRQMPLTSGLTGYWSGLSIVQCVGPLSVRILFSDLDYADDVALMAELLDLLFSTLDTFQ